MIDKSGSSLIRSDLQLNLKLLLNLDCTGF